MLACDVFVAVASSLTRETVQNILITCVGLHRLLFYLLSLSFVVCRRILLVGVTDF